MSGGTNADAVCRLCGASISANAASGGEPEHQSFVEESRLSPRDAITALYLRRQEGEISQAEYSELRLGITQAGRSYDSGERRFWALFTGGAVAATAALILLGLLIDTDGCRNTFALWMFMLAVVPGGVVVGVIGLAARSPSGPRGWLIFAAVLLTPIWILWAFGVLVGLGLHGASCL